MLVVKVRYHSIGKPVRTGLCHCRYCQLRTGTAFGISVYFKKENLIIESGNLKKYLFTTESGNTFETNFCTNCGTSMFWTLSHMEDLMGAAGGSLMTPLHFGLISIENYLKELRQSMLSISSLSRKPRNLTNYINLLKLTTHLD